MSIMFASERNKLAFGACLILAVGLSLALFMNPFFSVASLVGIFGLMIYLRYPRWTILVAILVKPAIDLTWNFAFIPLPFPLYVGNVSFDFINLQKVYSFLITVMAMGYAFQVRPWQKRWQQAVVWFLGLYGLSFLLSLDMRGAPDLLKVFSGFLLIALSEDLFKSYEEFKLFFKLYFFVMAIPFLVMFLQMADVVPRYYTTWIDGEEIWRVTAGYNHPVDVFRYVLFFCIFGVYYATSGTRNTGTRFSIALWSVFGVMTIYVSYFRMGLLVIFIPLVLYFVLTKRGSLTMLIIGFIAITVVLTWVDLVRLYSDTILLFETGNFDPIFNYRGAIWKDHWAHFTHQPFLRYFLGSGPYTDLNLYSPPRFDLITHNNAHNDFLRILIEHGVVGLTAYVLMIRRLFSHFAHGAFDDSNPLPVRSLRMLAPLSLLAILLMSITLRPTEEPSLMYYLALALSASRLNPMEDPNVNSG